MRTLRDQPGETTGSLAEPNVDGLPRSIAQEIRKSWGGSEMNKLTRGKTSINRE